MTFVTFKSISSDPSGFKDKQPGENVLIIVSLCSKCNLPPSLPNPLRHQNPTISNRRLPLLPFLHVSVDVNVLILLNILLNDLIDRDTKDLNVASRATRNNGCGNIQLYQLCA